MKGKKDNLYEALKKINPDQSLLRYLDLQTTFQLALTSKKYYLLLKPIIDEQRYQQDQQPKQRQPKNKIKKGKKQKEKETKQELPQIGVNIEKLSLEMAKKKVMPNIHQWIHITKSPINNQFIEKKFQIGTVIGFENMRTKQILYINRSLIDPTLNYDKGGFDEDLDNQYQQLYESEDFSNDYDFTSQESMLKRQKQILIKIQERKAKKQKQQELRYEDELEKVFKLKKIAIILCFGGSFSLAIYEGQKCVIHKSDKKYVCRKKAGERQLNKDKASGSNIKSMGSQIRRDQEKKHMFNVSQILTTHRNDLELCDLVFLQAPGLNRLVIINQSQTLSDLKGRLRSICLTAKKANYSQVQLIFQAITKFSLVSIKKEPKEENQSKKIQKL